MWKQISRNLRETFERCSLFNTGKDVTLRQESQMPANPAPPICRLRLLPCVVESFFRKQPILQHKEKVGLGEHEEKKENRNENCNTSSNFEQQYTFLGAMGWSGALVLGYVLSQRMWYKKLWFQETRPEPLKNEAPLNLIYLLSKIAETQPINNSILSSKSFNVGQAVKTSLAQEISADQVLDGAIDELRLAHEKVIGEAENRRGVACLSRNCNREAIEHFRRASHFNNAPAAFNLGQCYELGIGTKQDFKQAAEWYQCASDRGHPTAMYNLGVFYAHGWGGLKANVSRARNLFHQAALLGQVDAQAAIDRDPARKPIADTPLVHKEDKGHILSALENIIQYHHQTVWNIRDN